MKEENIKEKCINTIINTCKANFDKIKQLQHLTNDNKMAAVVTLNIDKNSVMIITQSGVIAKGEKHLNGQITARPLHLKDLSMEQIYNCLTQLSKSIS